MSWFPDALLPAGREGCDDAWQRVPVARGLLDLPSDVLLAPWAVPPRLEDPPAGTVTGPEAFGESVRPMRHELASGSSITSATLVDAGTRPVDRSGRRSAPSPTTATAARWRTGSASTRQARRSRRASSSTSGVGRGGSRPSAAPVMAGGPGRG